MSSETYVVIAWFTHQPPIDTPANQYKKTKILTGGESLDAAWSWALGNTGANTSLDRVELIASD